MSEDLSVINHIPNYVKESKFTTPMVYQIHRDYKNHVRDYRKIVSFDDRFDKVLDIERIS